MRFGINDYKSLSLLSSDYLEKQIYLQIFGYNNIVKVIIYHYLELSRIYKTLASEFLESREEFMVIGGIVCVNISKYKFML